MKTRAPKAAGNGKAERKPFTLGFGSAVLMVCAAMLGLGVVLSGASLLVSASFEETARQTDMMMQSMRHQTTADMYHDALRGVVYKEIYASMVANSALADEALAEVTEYGDAFKTEVAAQDELTLPDSVRLSLKTVKGPLNEYIRSAITIVKAAHDGKITQATMSLSAFETTFTALEGAMAKISDSIQTTSDQVRQKSGDVAMLASIANWASLGVSIIIATALLLLSRRFVTRPLISITEALRGLADGNLDVDVKQGQRIKEVSALQQVMTVFKDALKNRAELAGVADQAARSQEARMVEANRLNASVSDVVGAAVRGDFSGRIDAHFDDHELNSLAQTVNTLLQTVDRGISETGVVLSALANTDLTQRMAGKYEGALAKLKDDTNAVATRLTEVVMQLRSTSRSLKTATSEILEGTNDLAERTTRQAATIEETSASMEQLATTVTDNANRAKEASLNASAVTETAEDGGQVMMKANEAMQRITASSAKISNIIGLIDDIAFQTNLLALNASVEAARAGDAGKGFAVVAVEVRRLAQSAAGASSEVKALIEESGTEVASGSKLVAEAAGKLEIMLGAARKNYELLDAIARQNREQAASIEEINTAVRQMDEMTQHNAALVEETNAAIEQTEGQANELDRIVESFTVEDTSGGRARQRAA